MPYFALFYETVGDYVARRGQFREQHLTLARDAHARGELLLAGALADPVDRALLVFRAAAGRPARRVRTRPVTRTTFVRR
jgi:hypothetical protein